MPLLSVVVPVYNVERFLRQCVDSLLADDVDLQVIAVDDASTDLSGEILATYADDPRVAVVRHDQNQGLGAARNTGLREARGEYVLFVDSDDWVPQGSLTAIAQRVEETHADVVVFDFARERATGEVVRNDKAYLLAAAPQGTFRLDDHRPIVHLLQVVWNKAYRRSFLESSGLHFYGGYYEDLPWTSPVLMTARTIAVLDRVCYVYRVGRPGSIVQSNSQRHFDAFVQYDRVFEFMAAHPETQRFKSLIHARMTRHLLVILRLERVPPELRRTYFARITQAYREHRPAVPEVRRLQDFILRHDLYWAYRLAETVRPLRERLKRPGAAFVTPG